MNSAQLTSLSSVMDQYSLGAVQSYDQCEKSGQANCDTAFEKDIAESKKGRAQARELKGLIKNFYSCVRTSDNPEACAQTVRSQYRSRAQVAPRTDASQAKTALEMQATNPAVGPTSNEVIRRNAELAKPSYLPSAPAFDPSQLYKNLPSVNPIAMIPNRDLIGRTRTDFVRNPFKNDIRPPIFPNYRNRDGLPVNEERVAQLEALRAKYKVLASGVGYAPRAYCGNMP